MNSAIRIALGGGLLMAVVCSACGSTPSDLPAGNAVLETSAAGEAALLSASTPTTDRVDMGRAIPIVRRVAVLSYNPVNPDNPSQSVRDYFGWPDAFQLSEKIDDKLREVSHGYVDYRIVAKLSAKAFPTKTDGFRDTWASYLACRNDTSKCHQPDAAAYLPMMNKDFGRDFCAEINAKKIDEIWLWGAGYFGFDEFAYKMPGDAIPYQPNPYNYWIYDGRKKDLPDCGRPYFVMGWIPENSGDVGLHSFGHRIESAMTISKFSRGLWHRCGTYGDSEWTSFICIDQDEPGDAGCGDVHYPPNGTSDYDYGNTRSVSSRCDDYRRYPNLQGTKTPVSASTWGGTDVGYLSWWMGHLPRAWWNPIVCGSSQCLRRTACRTNADCGVGMACEYGPGCGGGTCAPCDNGGLMCPQVYQPVIGCDDRTYSNACMAHAACMAIKSSAQLPRSTQSQ